ncbi:MAG: hypothetical protein CL910_12700 [Deltaproteobacteria bacterium]|nr:hypothetical protein [Deltaproteobacteria bacterium]
MSAIGEATQRRIRPAPLPGLAWHPVSDLATLVLVEDRSQPLTGLRIRPGSQSGPAPSEEKP